MMRKGKHVSSDYTWFKVVCDVYFYVFIYLFMMCTLVAFLIWVI